MDYISMGFIKDMEERRYRLILEVKEMNISKQKKSDKISLLEGELWIIKRLKFLKNQKNNPSEITRILHEELERNINYIQIKKSYMLHDKIMFNPIFPYYYWGKKGIKISILSKELRREYFRIKGIISQSNYLLGFYK